MQIKLFIFKIIAVLFFSLNYANTTGQSLKNTEWIRIVAESMFEGKPIVNDQLSSTMQKYYFLEDSVLVSVKESYSVKLPYLINANILSIGSYIQYKIDSLNEQVLIISDIPKKKISSAKLNTFTLLNTDFLFDFLQSNKQLIIIGDSIIIANDLFCPTYNGELANIFLADLNGYSNTTCAGSFIISKDGSIKNIQISLRKGNKKDAAIIEELLASTKGHWIIPPTPKPLDCKVNFSISLEAGIDKFNSVRISLPAKND